MHYTDGRVFFTFLLYCFQVEDATQSVSQSVARVSKGSISGSSGAAAMASGLMTKFLGNGLARFTDR